MANSKHVTWVIILLFAVSIFSGAKKVVYVNCYLPQEHTPQNLLANLNYVEGLPFDGVAVITLPASRNAMNKGFICTYQDIYDNNFKSIQGKFTKVTYNWAFIYIGEPADWFDNASWDKVINNWRLFARASKAAGLKGIIFDNEMYGSNTSYYLWNYPTHVDSASKYSLDQYRAQVRLRGTQIMQACIEEFPNIEVLFFHGPYLSEPRMPVEVWPYGYDPSSQFELQGSLFVGMVQATVGKQAYVHDGGEIYDYRTLSNFQHSYNWRKDTIASAARNSPNIPAALRPFWSQKVKISFGLYPKSGTLEMTPAIMRTTLEYALRACDDFVWFYSESTTPWLASGNTAAQSWLQSIGGARSAANSGVYFNCDKGANVQTGGSFSFQFTYDNFTGSTATLTYLKKPSWITATAGNPTITGTAPNIPSFDTVVAVVSAAGKSDTTKLAITVSSYYIIEAESGQLTAPMQTGSDPNASKGQYITTPAGSGNTIFPKIEATYTFNAPISGTYYVWLKIYSPTINSTANYGIFYGFNGKFSKPGVANRTAGQYEYIMSATPNSLTAGSNQIILGHGSEQVRVDQIIITNSAAPLLPSGLTSSLPGNKNNVAKQKQNLSIRIMPNGAVEFLKETDGQLSVLDILGRELWANRGKSSNIAVWNPKSGNSRISNGIYFVVLQKKEGLSSEIGKFTFAR